MVSLPNSPAITSGPNAQVAQIVNGPFPKSYFNGFALASALTDVTVVLQNGDHPVAAIQANYSVMKQLAEALTYAVAESEKALRVSYLTIAEAGERQAAAAQGS